MIPEDAIIKDRLKAKSTMIQQNRIQLKDNEIRVSFFGDQCASIFIGWTGTKQEAEQLRNQFLNDSKDLDYYKKLCESIKQDRDAAVADSKMLDEITQILWYHRNSDSTCGFCVHSDFEKILQILKREKK